MQLSSRQGSYVSMQPDESDSSEEEGEVPEERNTIQDNLRELIGTTGQFTMDNYAKDALDEKEYQRYKRIIVLIPESNRVYMMYSLRK